MSFVDSSVTASVIRNKLAHEIKNNAKKLETDIPAKGVPLQCMHLVM